jgi:cytochrome P450
MSVDSSQPVQQLFKDFMEHPYEILERLRAAGRVHPIIFPHGAKVWLVTGYDDVRQLLSDPRVSKDGSRMNELFARHSGVEVEEDEHAGVGFNDELSQHMLNSDPPRHTRLRSLVSKEFNPKRMDSFRPRLEQVADRLLDAMDDGREVVELVGAYTLPLPIITICDLLGVSAEDEATFRRWAVELVGAGHPPEVVEKASQDVMAYARSSIDAKLEDPGEDMISALLKGKDDGDRLTLDEMVGMFFLFMIAGHVTSMHTLTNSIFSLLTHPEELAKLRADMSLMPGAVDELMRYDGGVGVATFRFTKEPITVGDVTIPADEILALSVNSAHRDASRYPDPNRLDITRHPTGVLGFGFGTHYCIGAPLAKIQSDVALTKLLTRFPDMELAADPDSLPWEQSTLLRGLITLPVHLHGKPRD